MAKIDVKKALLDHSSIKVRLLGEYLKRYLNIISNDGYTERIKIYDLFCGEGLYENNGEGSPLVIMRIVKDIHFVNVAKLSKIPKIDCQFNDIDSNKVLKVKKVIEEKSLFYSSFGEIQFTSNDYRNEVRRLPDVFAKLRNQKAFVFIDPYGYKHIKASDIKSLLSKGNAEVLLFLPTQFMYRFNSNGTPEALMDFIEELTEYKNWRESDSVWKFIDQLREAFRGYLGSKYFVDTFSIQKDPSTVFCLFFFSSHIKGFEKMLEAKWDIDTEQGKGWTYTGNSPSLFFDLKTNLLEERLKIHLQKSKMTNGEIYEFTLRSGYLPKHTNEILYNWQKLGVLKVSPREVRKGAFYISYNHFKKEGSKVSFELK